VTSKECRVTIIVVEEPWLPRAQLVLVVIVDHVRAALVDIAFGLLASCGPLAS
jgi:hypothetical protein